MSSDMKSEVRDFWNRNVNQFNQLQSEDVGTKDFYQAALDLRYEYHYHLPPLFDRLAQEYPQGRLLEVGCSMGNDSFEFALAQKLHRLRKDRPTSFRRRLFFFKPQANNKAVPLCIARNCLLLYFERDTFSLFGRGNTNVANVFGHVGG